MQKLSILIINFIKNSRAQIQWAPNFPTEDIEENNKVVTKPLAVENYVETVEVLEIQQELSETGSFQGIAQCWRCTEATSYEGMFLFI